MERERGGGRRAPNSTTYGTEGGRRKFRGAKEPSEMASSRVGRGEKVGSIVPAAQEQPAKVAFPIMKNPW